MKRSSARLLKLLELEASREREAARRLAEGQRLLNERRLRFTELEGYLRDYQRQFITAARAGTGAAQARSSQLFITRLHHVLDQQRQAVAEAEDAVAERRTGWLEAKRRVDALNKTIERLDREQSERDRKTEQALADEAAQRRFRGP
jgi:flagellar FliJ protein